MATATTKPPHDLILGKNSRHLKPLVHRKTESDDFTDEADITQMAAITTRKQAKEEASEHEFTDIDIFETTIKERTQQSRSQRREQRRERFDEGCKNDPEEEPTGIEPFRIKQLKDQTLAEAWGKAKDNTNHEFTIRNELLYKASKEGNTRLAVPSGKRRRLLQMAHSTPLAAHLGRNKTL